MYGLSRCYSQIDRAANNRLLSYARPAAGLAPAGRDVGKCIDAVLHLHHTSGMETAAVHSRISPDIKKRAESILSQLGLSPTEAIRIFYTQITLRNGLPFEVEIPNSTTLKAVNDSRKGHRLQKHASVDELFSSWDK
jgi:DNA-damage-inducible protein J